MLPEPDLLRIVTDNARVGLVVVTPERRYAYANATYAQILGLPPQNLVGLRLQDVLAGVYDDQVRPRLDRAFSGERVNFELRTPTPLGDRYYDVRYEPTTVDGGMLVVVVISETTDVRNAQLDSNRFAAIAESTDDAIIGKDLNGIVTSWNDGAERIFGYSAAEIVGTSITRLIPDDRLDEETHILDLIRRGERVHHFETTRLTKEGAAIHVSVTTSPIKDAHGNIIGGSKVARDITQQKLSEEHRRFQQTMLLTERELTLDGILVVDDRGTVMSYNGRFARMWGIPAGGLREGRDAALLQAVIDQARDPERFVARVRELHDRHDEQSQDEIELVDGRTFDRYSAPMRHPDGTYYGRVWYFRDVTERKSAEKALRRERDNAQRYLDTAGVILLALDIEGRITLVNNYACSAFGWHADQLLGRDFIDLCVPERLRGPIRDKLRVVQLGDDSTVASEIVTKGGEERLIEWSTTFLRDDAGAIIGTFSSGADITDRQRAIEALRAADERTRFALESAAVGIWDVDYTTRTVRVSDIVERQYGLEPGTFAGTFESVIAAVHPEDRRGLTRALRNAERTGADFSTQHRAVWPDGTVRRITSSGRIHHGEDGRPLRGIGVTLDVTQRHLLEAQYHQAQKLEAVGRLAGGVAHDFNNLLTAILGYCRFLLEDLDSHDPRRSDVEQIFSAGESAAGLTRQLLAFSRKQIIEPTLLDLNDVVRTVRGILDRLIGEDIEVAVQLDADLGIVKADRGQIEQIVMNLAVNARDAMPNGGTLTIETKNVELDGEYATRHLSATPGAYVAVIVSDTGVGMSPDVQDRLFEPFFTTKEVGKGTGLGLATVHGIVMRGGGSIGVYSELGKGTVFAVYLPRTSEEPMTTPKPPVARSARGGETVLVVEDSDRLRLLAQRLLERQGYTALVAANIKEARRIFDENPSISVILTDVVMPGGSGPDLIASLVSLRPELKVIYMSGYTEDVITHRGVLDPGVAFLHKPFTSESFAAKLREVLDR